MARATSEAASSVRALSVPRATTQPITDPMYW